MIICSSFIESLNQWGMTSLQIALSIIIQSSILIVLIFVIDLFCCKFKQISANFRYGLWILILIKLLLPPSLPPPTGIGCWIPHQIRQAAFNTHPAIVYDIADHQKIPIETISASKISGKPNVILNKQGSIFLVWIITVSLLITILYQRIRTIHKKLKKSINAPRDITDLLECCCKKLKIRKNIQLKVTEHICSPAVYGFFKPVILLPEGMLEKLSYEQLENVFIHELVHIQRHDTLINWIQTLTQIVFFFHPLLWFINHRIKHLRELAVDEQVLAVNQSTPHSYIETLIRISEIVFKKPGLCLHLLGIAESRKALERRIMHMSTQTKYHSSKFLNWSVIALIGVLLIPMAPGIASDKTEKIIQTTAPELPAGIKALFDLNKEDLLKKFGKPQNIFYANKKYTLNDLPKMYYLGFEDISFRIDKDRIVEITLLSPKYVFANGIRPKDTQAKVVAAFGPNYVIKKSVIKDFLIYPQFGLTFEIYKPKRLALEINIKRDYGNPILLQFHKKSIEFSNALPAKIKQLNIDTANINEVLKLFGPPLKYVWGNKSFKPAHLPDTFIMSYPCSFMIYIRNGKIMELRHEYGSKYIFNNKLHIGSTTIKETLALLGQPEKTVISKKINWQESQNILFKDIDGHKGYCYYHVPEHHVRIWFANDKIIAIYMTRSVF